MATVRFNRITPLIAIKAYLNLAEIVMKNLRTGAHKITPENMVRIIAVLGELSLREVVDNETREELLSLANRFSVAIPKKYSRRSIDKLVTAYSFIFRDASI